MESFLRSNIKKKYEFNVAPAIYFAVSLLLFCAVNLKAQTPGGQFNNYGSSVNAHTPESDDPIGAVDVFTNYNDFPEGSVVIAWSSLKYNNNSGGYNNIGVWGLAAILYENGQGINSVPRTNADANYFATRTNIFYNMPGSGSRTPNDQRAYIGDLGPNRNFVITILHNYGNDCSGCDKDRDFYDFNRTTAKLKAPVNVAIIKQVNPRITWDKGTKYVDNLVAYRISRKLVGGTYQLIATIPGDKRECIDATLTSNGDYIYSVQTVLSANAPADWNHTPTAYEAAVETSTFTYQDYILTATTDQSGKVKLNWPSFNSIVGAGGLTLYRDGVDIADLSKITKSYNDLDVVAGMYYNYTIGLVQDDDDNTPPIDENYRSNKAAGKSLPNGKISGYVKGKTGGGVPNVAVTATTKNDISDGLNPAKEYSASDTTDADGYYEISGLFYAQKVEYNVVPKLLGYDKPRFDPPVLMRKLALDSYSANSVNFTDTASFAISGNVYFAAIKNDNGVEIKLPAEGTEIWLNGENTNVKTKTDGSYSLNIINGGTYKVQAKYKDHIINIPGSNVDTVQSVLVSKLENGIDFVDHTTDSLFVKVAASCDAPISNDVLVGISSVKAGVTSTNASLNLEKRITVDSYKFTVPTANQPERGVYKIILPATKFNVQLLSINGGGADQSTKEEYFKKSKTIPNGVFLANLTGRDSVATAIKKMVQDTIQRADTLRRPDSTIYKIIPLIVESKEVADTVNVYQAHAAEFIYHSKIKVIVNNGNNPFPEKKHFKKDNKDQYLLSQNESLPLRVKLAEDYSFTAPDGTVSNYSCALDTGTIFIYDAISDIIDRQEIKLDTIAKIGNVDKTAKYMLKVGTPVLEYPYLKTIQIEGVVGGRSASVIIPAAVQGERARNATFVTKTPEMPLFVLHDPPGDRSFATLAKGTSISTSVTTDIGGGAGAGIYTHVRTGIGVNPPFLGPTGSAFNLEAEVEAGADQTKGVATNITTTFNEAFSTSGEETLVGNNGDVYVGASMNMTYALTDVLTYSNELGDMKRDTALAVQNDGFNTTFAYTEYHIKNTLLDQLNTLYSINKNAFDSALQKYNNGDKSITDATLAELNRAQLENKAGIDAWKEALRKNDVNRKAAKEVKLPDGTPGVVGNNISFSAGVVYENSLTTDDITTNTTDVSVYVNGSVRAGVEIRAGDFQGAGYGGLASFRFNWNKSTVKDKNNTKTVSYHLEDNDIGDFLSVNLGVDTAYGTAVFKTVSGSTSCPHEENTQYRHLPAMQITGANVQRNVPSDQAAKFEILVANRSESDETVEYAIKLDPKSNLNGARVLVGGQDVTNGQATYYIPTGKSFKLPVEVFRGPLTSEYENLSLVIFSTCDNTLDDISESNVAKPSVKINAYFQNKCSEIDLFKPGNNWVVNQSNLNNLYVAFSKYDASEASPLSTVGLQYRKLNTDFENTQWTTVNTIPKSELINKYYDYAFDVSGLPDGNYELRAIAVCAGVDVNYSQVYTGTIDRKSAVAFGVPSPANGILTIADIVGVTFNKNIVYNDASNPVSIKLERKDNGQIIPAVFVSDGKNFQIKTQPESLINDYENVELTATIKNLMDANGNKVADSVSWSFVVNLSPVYWSPNSVVVNATENEPASFSAALVNKSALNQNVTITKYPAWLTPSVKNPKIVPQGQQSIDFSVSNSLNTGIYTDTVVATINDKQQYLYVTVNVLRTPPNWTVNPANFKYNMSFTTQFSIDQTDALTSKDIRDKMGVFVGDECRGVANIEYDRTLDKYIAYVTAYSNAAANEQLTVHFWDTYPGIEYQGKERLSFVPNGNLGNLQNPYLVHPEGVYQTIPLKKGWTWISLNVQNPDMSLKNALASLKPTEGDVIKTIRNNNTYSQYSKTLGWAGTVSSLDLYNSYMIYLSKADTLRILGNFITEAAHVKLNKGWNWTGYPMAVNMDINTYLANFNPADGSQLVSQDEFAQYNTTSKTWSGSLKFLRPGKGYKLYSGADGFTIPVMPYVPSVSLVPDVQLPPINNPAAPVIVNNPSTVVNSTVNNTTVNTVNYENNSSVTTVINQGGQVVNNTTNRYETYIYVENKLVNIVNQTILPDGQAVGFIPVNGSPTDEGKAVQIKVYDKEEKKEYTAKIEQPVTQQADLITGNVASPVVLVLEGLADVDVSNSLDSLQVNKDEVFTYQIKIRNAGPDLAVNVALSDTLATTFDYLGSDNGLTFDPLKRTLQAIIPQLKSGEEQRFNVRLKANMVGDLAIGNGLVALNNDDNMVNNTITQLRLSVIDKRANSAKILIPSLFTPNGDGINDRFEIVGLNEFYVSNSLIVFNKNYNEVYRRQNYRNDWTGDNLPMGSYGYILKATDKDNKEVVYKGFITIVYQ
jgi:gliding motility-associated-like protein